jgi:curved DNA-binding protein CbpA
MTDYFALLGEARRLWLDPEQLKQKYFARARERPADSELNEAFRVLSDPKLRLQHLLHLEGIDLKAGREVPSALADLFWQTGGLLREVDRWKSRHTEVSSTLSRALLRGEQLKLRDRLGDLEAKLNGEYEKA